MPDLEPRPAVEVLVSVWNSPENEASPTGSVYRLRSVVETANALGLAISPSVLMRADQVIE